MSPKRRRKAATDPYYGHEETAKICARFTTHLFACPDLPPLSTSVPPAPSPPLANFIAYTLHRTRLHSSVTFAALYFLQRLKVRFPAARGSSGHRLFISAFMVASKVICDDTYSNKSWTVVGRIFSLQETNQMEREMCSYLEWRFNIEPTALKEFEDKVRRDFAGSGPYPVYDVPAATLGNVQDAVPTNGFAAPSFLTPPSMMPLVQQLASASTFVPSHSVVSSPPTIDVPPTLQSCAPVPTSSVPTASHKTLVEHKHLSTSVVSGDTKDVPATSQHPIEAPSHSRAAVQPSATTSAPLAVNKSARPGEILARPLPCVW